MPPEEEIYIKDEPVLLCSLTENFKANILIAALKEKGIPVHKKSRGVGQYLTILGMNFLNQDDIEIYVPSRLYDEAQEVLVVILGEDGSEEIELINDDSEDSDDSNNLDN